MNACRHRLVKGIVLALTITPVLYLAGCQTVVAPTSTLEEMPAMSVDRVILTPGDEIEVKFFYNPDLNEVMTIRPDGKITLQLIGDLDAAGKTPEELKYVIRRLAELFVEQPEVSVFVRKLNSRKVFVGGSVLNPGALGMPGPMTALDALLLAGGANMRSANLESVLIIRHRDGRRYGAALNLENALEGRATTPFYLEPGDIVYVPNTAIVQVGQWIDQHINKIIPQFGVTYSDTVSGGGTIGVDTARDFTPVF